jgi:hypothetical protein
VCFKPLAPSSITCLSKSDLSGVATLLVVILRGVIFCGFLHGAVSISEEPGWLSRYSD